MAKGSQEGNTAGKGLHDARSTSNTGGAHRPVAPKESGAGKQADNTKRIGELSWVRIKGYPWWPCLRVLLEDVPAHLREEVLNARKPLAQLAFCFGDHLFIWAQREELQPWATNKNSFTHSMLNLFFLLIHTNNIHLLCNLHGEEEGRWVPAALCAR